MSRFSVEPSVLQREAGVLSRCAQGLGTQNDVLESVLHDGFASGSAYDTVMDRLRGISRQISYGQSVLLFQHSALSSIADEYIRTENSILGSFGSSNERIGTIRGKFSSGRSSENRDGDSGFSWFKEGAIWEFLEDMLDLGLISARFYAKLFWAFLNGDTDAYQEAFNELIGSLLAEGKADLVALIPRYLSNEGVIAFYEALRTGDANGNLLVETILEYYGNTLTEQDIIDHYNSNVNALPGVYTPGQFIENQDDWGSIMYGKDSEYAIVNGFANQSSMYNSGCGVIAVANALTNLGYDLSYEEMAQLISDFERDGIALNGVIGTSPMAIYEYMQNKGFDTSYITSTDPNEINSFGNDYDTFIVTGYNDQDDVTNCLHTACITKEPDGRFTIHNSANGVACTYDTLDEAVSHLSVYCNGNSEPIMITGVNN